MVSKAESKAMGMNSASMLNWASFWRQLGGNFHTDLATLPQLE